MEYSQVEAVALTQKLVELESTNPGTYEFAVAEFIIQWFAQYEIPVIKQPVLDGRCNIIAKLEGAVKQPNLAYVCHMDTVPLGDGWDQDPLTPTIVGGKMNGRGSCDMKAGLAAAMIAFRNVAQLDLPLSREFLFVATVDEEDLMLGAEQLVKDGYVTEESYVLDAEPTAGVIQVGHKGKTWFTVSATGTAAHASTPEKGCDAVVAMATFICGVQKRIKALAVHGEMGPCSATFGSISGGNNINVVPGACQCGIDMRLVPPTTNAQSIALVEQAIQEAVEAVPGSVFTYTILAQRPAIEKDPEAYLLTQLSQATQAVLGTPAPVTFFPGYTDSGVVAAMTGNVNCMSYGPGDLGYAHKPNEFVECTDITRSVDVLTHLAKEILIETGMDSHE